MTYGININNIFKINKYCNLFVCLYARLFVIKMLCMYIRKYFCFFCTLISNYSHYLFLQDALQDLKKSSSNKNHG